MLPGQKCWLDYLTLLHSKQKKKKKSYKSQNSCQINSKKQNSGSSNIDAQVWSLFFISMTMSFCFSCLHHPPSSWKMIRSLKTFSFSSAAARGNSIWPKRAFRERLQFARRPDSPDICYMEWHLIYLLVQREKQRMG